MGLLTASDWQAQWISTPKGTGKDKRVAVFAQGDNAAKAKEAGAITEAEYQAQKARLLDNK